MDVILGKPVEGDFPFSEDEIRKVRAAFFDKFDEVGRADCGVWSGPVSMFVDVAYVNIGFLIAGNAEDDSHLARLLSVEAAHPDLFESGFYMSLGEVLAWNEVHGVVPVEMFGAAARHPDALAWAERYGRLYRGEAADW